MVPSRLLQRTWTLLGIAASPAAEALTTPVRVMTMLPPLAMSMLAPLAVTSWPLRMTKSTPPLLVAPPMYWMVPLITRLSISVGSTSSRLMSNASVPELLATVMVKVTVSPWSKPPNDGVEVICWVTVRVGSTMVTPGCWALLTLRSTATAPLGVSPSGSL
ncbi:hypothetical protein D3C76_984730 [compost metagenome]